MSFLSIKSYSKLMPFEQFELIYTSCRRKALQHDDKYLLFVAYFITEDIEDNPLITNEDVPFYSQRNFEHLDE